MHPAGAMNKSPVSALSPPLNRAVAGEAARWFLLLASGEASARERQRCEDWRLANPEHERAWQRAAQVSQMSAMVPAAMGKSVLRRPERPDVERRKRIKTLVLLMAGVPVAWSAVHALPWQAWRADYRTTTGERRMLSLPDGTIVELDTATAIDVHFDQQRRAVSLLEGTIMVSTAPDPLARNGVAARPFHVATAQGRATPVGTRFTVRQEDGRSFVEVLAGAVDLQPTAGGQPHRLRAGWAASFSRDAITPEQPLLRTAGLWTRGVVTADDMPLQQLLAELGRYRRGFLDCDPAVADLRVTGAFQSADVDGAIANIARLLSLDVRYRTRYWITLLPGPKK
jgi:transmembrane sensor